MKFVLIENKTFESEESFWDTLKKGFKVEQEHKKTVDGDLVSIMKIVLDHLSESVTYYNALDEMEKGLKKEDDEPEEEKEEEKEEESEDEEKEED